MKYIYHYIDPKDGLIKTKEVKRRVLVCYPDLGSANVEGSLFFDFEYIKQWKWKISPMFLNQ